VKASAITLLRGALSRSPRCPQCGSSTIRPSKESYEGRFAVRYGLKPYRCRDCHRHFALSPRAQSQVAVGEPGSDDAAPWERLVRRQAPPCPHCGEHTAGLSAQPVTSLADRALSRRRYRCQSCRRHFVAARPADAVANILIALLLLAGLVLALGQVKDLVKRATAPTVKRWTPPRH
jgi:transposase-like protein